MGRSPLAQTGKLLCEGDLCLQRHLPVVLRDLTVLGTACPGECDGEMEAHRQQGMG